MKGIVTSSFISGISGALFGQRGRGGVAARFGRPFRGTAEFRGTRRLREFEEL